MQSIMVASRNESATETLRACFQPEYQVDVVDTRDACIEAVQKKRCDFVFIDLDLLGTSLSPNDYRNALQPFWHLLPAVETIVMSRPENIRDAVMAVKAGASNYLTFPLNADEARFVTESLRLSARMEYELRYLRDRFWQTDSLEIVQTQSPAMKSVFDKIQSVAPTRTTVLLVGETGTGKGVLANLIHRHSHRSHKQFISVHCGALPDTLIESELFGHEKGAFTGAHRRKLGKFEISHEGTIFLDEIGTITPTAQIKILQVLQDQTFSRLGGQGNIEVDVRIVAATNADIKEMNRQGQFRSDLYYRLSVFPIEIPPLRERIEDIPSLIQAFLKRLNRFYAKNVRDVHPQVMRSLERYPWPGNIRELENLIERAYILESTNLLTPDSFPADLIQQGSAQRTTTVDTSLPLSEVRKRGIEAIERQYLTQLLTLHRGRIKRTANAAAITPRQLHKLLTKYLIRKEEFKNLPIDEQKKN